MNNFYRDNKLFLPHKSADSDSLRTFADKQAATQRIFVNLIKNSRVLGHTNEENEHAGFHTAHVKCLHIY